MDYIQKTYKYKLRLNIKQQKQVDEWINTCRLVFNLALETRTWAWRQQRRSIGYYELCRQMTDLRTEFDWIGAVPAGSLIDVLERQERAYKRFFNGYTNRPGHIKRKHNGSITFKKAVSVSGNKIKLPKIGIVKYFNSRNIVGDVKRATITKRNNQHYISILVRQERNTQPHPNHDSQVGIDMGIAFFASLSTGEQIDNPKFRDKYYKQLRIESRSLSRKEKGSNNYEKQRMRIVRLYRKIYNCRQDFSHKTSSDLVKRFGVICAEDLNMGALLKGKNISKHIYDAAWSGFFDKLDYKLDWNNGQLIRVNPAYTSQTCSHCGAVDKKSRISQSKFVCTECGAEDNADINAAKNILAKALASVR